MIKKLSISNNIKFTGDRLAVRIETEDEVIDTILDRHAIHINPDGSGYLMISADKVEIK